MYDELVKRLRDAAKMSDALAVLLPHSEGNATAKLYNAAADVVPVVKGKWAYQGQLVIAEEYPTYKCTVCGKIIPADWRKNCHYCPNCGAMMEES